MTIKPFRFAPKLNPLIAATQAGMAFVLHQHAFPDHHFEMGEAYSFGLQDANLTMTRIGNRSGVPLSAYTFQFLVSSESFEAEVRVVWEEGALWRPIMTHTNILRVSPDTEEGWTALNDWLRSF
jgi:hypothetical protein